MLFVLATLSFAEPLTSLPCNLGAELPGPFIEVPVPTGARAKLALGWSWEDPLSRQVATLSCLQYPNVLAPDEANDILTWSSESMRGGMPGPAPKPLLSAEVAGEPQLRGLELEIPMWSTGYRSRHRARWWTIGSMVYQLEISVPDGQPFSSAQLAFLDSFRLLAPNTEHHPSDTPMITAAWATPDAAWTVDAPDGAVPEVRPRPNTFEGVQLPFQAATWSLADRDLSLGLRWVTVPAEQIAGRDARALVDAVVAEQAKMMQFELESETIAEVPGGYSREQVGNMGAMAHRGRWPVHFRVVVVGDRIGIAVIHARESRFRAEIAQAFVRSLAPAPPPAP